jgi:hypothetical protein
MEQVLRIFRKDTRHLWPTVPVVLALIIVHAILDVRSSPFGRQGDVRIDSISVLLKIFLPLAIWFLIAQAIFQEALLGEQQFWLTRPYRWTSLLASKALFVAVFTSLPLCLSDCFILAVQGLPVLGNIGQLLYRQVIVAALFLLPSFAFAAVTAGLAQFVLAWFLLLLTFISEEILATSIYHSNGFNTMGGTPVLFFGLALITCGIVIWQYARRDTVAARIALLAVACCLSPVLMFLGHYVQPANQGSPNGFHIRISFDPGQRAPGDLVWKAPSAGYVRVRIPLTVAGLPAGKALRGTAVTTISEDGKSWPGPGNFYGGSLEQTGNAYWQTIDLERGAFELLKLHPAALHTSYNLDIFQDQVEATIPVAKSSFFVPGVGFCRSNLDIPQFQLSCRAGLTQRPEIVVKLDPPTVPSDLGTFPEYSIPWGLSPTTDLGVTPFSVEKTGARLEFVRRRTVGTFLGTLDMKDIRLSNFTLPPS